MSSRDGFPRADLDSGYYSDPKVVALARKLRIVADICMAVELHTATILASWAAGERLTWEEALPAWWLDPVDEKLIDALIAVRMLDSEGRIPAHAWQNWSGPARDARERNHRKTTIAGLVSGGLSRDEAIAKYERDNGPTSGRPHVDFEPEPMLTTTGSTSTPKHPERPPADRSALKAGRPVGLEADAHDGRGPDEGGAHAADAAPPSSADVDDQMRAIVADPRSAPEAIRAANEYLRRLPEVRV